MKINIEKHTSTKGILYFVMENSDCRGCFRTEGDAEARFRATVESARSLLRSPKYIPPKVEIIKSVKVTPLRVINLPPKRSENILEVL